MLALKLEVPEIKSLSTANSVINRLVNVIKERSIKELRFVERVNSLKEENTRLTDLIAEGMYNDRRLQEHVLTEVGNVKNVMYGITESIDSSLSHIDHVVGNNDKANEQIKQMYSMIQKMGHLVENTHEEVHQLKNEFY